MTKLLIMGFVCVGEREGSAGGGEERDTQGNKGKKLLRHFYLYRTLL
jgi:hypothetical protein